MSLNDFVILEKLGSGSFASVYKARRLIDQKIYALKKIDLKALGLRQKNNALNQIRLLACLKSPFIIGYCESFFDEKVDILCIAMQYADGGDLYKKIQNHKKQRTCIPQIQIWKIFIHLLYGLNELHSRSILHRDLKSENVFIANQTYKIGDMNVSKIVKNGRLAQTQTGTPYYASPEVWNDHPYNEKSDIWSLGCILYEATTLRPPFEGKSMQKLFQQINKAPTPKIPKNFSKQLQSIIDQCLQKNPNLRPSTKNLLSLESVKIYENMLIEYKPNLDSHIKENLLLKTIYMPVVKKELNKKLPQSNYKSDRIQTISQQLSWKFGIGSKQIKKLDFQQPQQTPTKDICQNQNTISKEIQKISIQKSHKLKQALSDIQPILSNIENILNQNKSLHENKNNNKSKNENSSRSKEKSQKKRNQSTSNRKRVNSCRIFKEKENINNTSRKDLMSRAEIILNSQKVTKSKPPTNNLSNLSTQKKKVNILTNEKSSLNIIEEVIENDQFKQKLQKNKQKQLQPRKLIFDDDVENKKNQAQQINMNKTKKQKVKSAIQQKNYEDYLKLKTQDERKQLDISKSPYLGDTIKNLSNISDKNHQYYDFKLEKKQKEEKEREEQIITKEQYQNQKIQNRQIQVTDIKDHEEKQNFEIQFALSTPINIVIDVNENYQKICPKQNNPLKQSRKVCLIVGFQKLRCFYSKSTLKISLCFFSKLKNLSVLYKIKCKKQQSIRRYQQENYLLIVQNKIKGIQKLETFAQKTEVKRARSKSIPKLEKSKHKIQQNQQLDNFLLNKITQKDLFVRQQPIKKCQQYKNQYKVNHSTQKNLDQKIKQLALIPKYSNSNKKPSKENNIPLKQLPQYYHTDQKQNRAPLIDRKSDNILSSNLSSHKKIFPHSIFSQGSKQFDLKKRKIFEDVRTSNNLVHNLNDQLDRINLERKIKKYINV